MRPQAPADGISRFSGQYAFLSNPYAYHVSIDGITYPSAEHAFQALKSNAHHIRRQVAMMPNWRDAKAHGRVVQLRPCWDEYLRYDEMTRVLQCKFSPYGLLAPYLAKTTGPLIEGNTWHDNTWGVCYCGRCTGGHNILGWLLMQLRAKLVNT